MLNSKSSACLIICFSLLQLASSASHQVPPKLWAAISVSDPLFQKGWTKDLMIHFTLVNDGTDTVGPKVDSWRLVVNGEELEDSNFNFAQGPKDARWTALPAGESLRFTYALEKYFSEPGVYRVAWRGKGFETLPIEFRVMPSRKLN